MIQITPRSLQTFVDQYKKTNMEILPLSYYMASLPVATPPITFLPNHSDNYTTNVSMISIPSIEDINGNTFI